MSDKVFGYLMGLMAVLIVGGFVALGWGGLLQIPTLLWGGVYSVMTGLTIIAFGILIMSLQDIFRS